MFGRVQNSFDFRVDSGAVSHQGLVRTENEDAWHASVEDGAFIVADGMGGHAAGEIASSLTVRTVAEHLRQRQAVLRAFVQAPTLEARRAVFAAMDSAAQRAHEAVLAEGARRPEYAGMGATLDLVVLLGKRAFVLHVGDGRVYLVRPDVTVQLTNDHDVRAALGVQVSMPPPARTNVPNRLLNAIGVGGTIVTDCVSFEVTSGDRIVLCTDGVHQMINDEPSMGKRGGSAADTARALIDMALAKGGRDNATALVVDVCEPVLQRKTHSLHSPSRDLDVTLASPLLSGIARPTAMRLLSAGIEVELPEGRIPRIVTRDRVAYIVLEGEVRRSDGASLGAGAFLYAESLVESRRPTTYEATGPVRAVRIRSDDFRELCAADLRLAASLYERLARHLAHIDR